MQDQFVKLETEFSTLIDQHDIKINVLARVHLQELEELESENEILKKSWLVYLNFIVTFVITSHKNMHH